MLIQQNNHPLIMGILNLTPDSFYSHSRKDGPNIFDDLVIKESPKKKEEINK